MSISNILYEIFPKDIIWIIIASFNNCVICQKLLLDDTYQCLNCGNMYCVQHYLINVIENGFECRLGNCKNNTKSRDNVIRNRQVEVKCIINDCDRYAACGYKDIVCYCTKHAKYKKIIHYPTSHSGPFHVSTCPGNECFAPIDSINIYGAGTCKHHSYTKNNKVFYIDHALGNNVCNDCKTGFRTLYSCLCGTKRCIYCNYINTFLQTVQISYKEKNIDTVYAICGDCKRSSTDLYGCISHELVVKYFDNFFNDLKGNIRLGDIQQTFIESSTNIKPLCDEEDCIDYVDYVLINDKTRSYKCVDHATNEYHNITICGYGHDCNLLGCEFNSITKICVNLGSGYKRTVNACVNHLDVSDWESDFDFAQNCVARSYDNSLHDNSENTLFYESLTDSLTQNNPSWTFEINEDW
jgi:hypothetical protein